MLLLTVGVLSNDEFGSYTCFAGMIETSRMKETDISAASGHRLDPNEIAKVGSSYI
jgi:hypothetical protein